MASHGVVSAWQLGITKKILEPPPDIFDAPKVNGSAEAYGYWGIPDAFPRSANCAVTAVLVRVVDPVPRVLPLLPDCGSSSFRAIPFALPAALAAFRQK